MLRNPKAFLKVIIFHSLIRTVVIIIKIVNIDRAPRQGFRIDSPNKKCHHYDLS
ncbi:MAG: hypothetical protein PWK00_05925 [Coxiella burnetii]|nr:hypothetical protein [Coxiella burnetii]